MVNDDARRVNRRREAHRDEFHLLAAVGLPRRIVGLAQRLRFGCGARTDANDAAGPLAIAVDVDVDLGRGKAAFAIVNGVGEAVGADVIGVGVIGDGRAGIGDRDRAVLTLGNAVNGEVII